MTSDAMKVLRDLRDAYVKEGFPPEKQCGFHPGPDEVSAYRELEAHGYIKRATSQDWSLTPAGVAWIMTDIGPMSRDAEDVMVKLRQGYIEAKTPPRRQIGFSPSSGEATAFRELRARGILEKMTARDYCFTEHGVRRALG